MTMKAHVLGAFTACLAVAACSGTPQPPLYSALQATGSFGYFTEDLGGDRVRVGYRAPIRKAHGSSRAERQRESERLVSLAYDLALLHAAELATGRGAPSFDVSDRQNDVDATVQSVYGPDPFYAPWPYWHHRYAPFPLYGGPVYSEPYTEIAVSVTFVAELHPGAGGAFATAETLDRLQREHPTAALGGRIATPP